MKRKSKGMIVFGLTGGIGMGKSAVAAILEDFGIPVYNADKAVHALLRKGGGAVKPVAALFPDAYRRGAIDRKRLGHIVFARPAELKKLEKIIHPLVRQEERKFLREARARKKRFVVLEIPLLFETRGQKRCDYVICVTAPKKVQNTRVLQRPGMDREKLKGIRSRQFSDKKKCALADYVINTGGSHAQTEKQLCRMLDKIEKSK